jgi:RNA polymerase sigma-70 factor (ECF subfamily)
MVTETDVIARATRGDEAAQRALYEAYRGAAFRLSYVLLQDTRDAEEVVQDAFAYLLRNLCRYDPGRGSFWTWLRVTLVSRCRNKRRRKQLAIVSLDRLEGACGPVPDPSPIGDPASRFEMRDTQRAVWEALQQVSSGARDALILRYYEGLPYAEIAEVLGCSPGAARARVVHGKVQMRRLLSELATAPAYAKVVGRISEVG